MTLWRPEPTISETFIVNHRLSGARDVPLVRDRAELDSGAGMITEQTVAVQMVSFAPT